MMVHGAFILGTFSHADIQQPAISRGPAPFLCGARMASRPTRNCAKPSTAVPRATRFSRRDTARTGEEDGLFGWIGISGVFKRYAASRYFSSQSAS